MPVFTQDHRHCPLPTFVKPLAPFGVYNSLCKAPSCTSVTRLAHLPQLNAAVRAWLESTWCPGLLDMVSSTRKINLSPATFLPDLIMSVVLRPHMAPSFGSLSLEVWKSFVVFSTFRILRPIDIYFFFSYHKIILLLPLDFATVLNCNVSI